MFIHWFARDSADEVRLGAVCKRQRMGELVERFRTDWTLRVELLSLVTLPVPSQGKYMNSRGMDLRVCIACVHMVHYGMGVVVCGVRGCGLHVFYCTNKLGMRGICSVVKGYGVFRADRPACSATENAECVDS